MLLARVPSVDAEHKGPVVNLISWIAMTTMCLAVVTVLISKFVVLGRLTWNDSFLVAAMLFAIAFTIAVNQQVGAGLGSGLESTNLQYDKFQITGYAWNMLYVVSLTCGKMSTLSLLLALAPTRSFRIPMKFVGGFIVVWATAGTITSAFQCSLPQPYLITTTKCIDQVAFWQAADAISILTDISLIVLPIWLVHNLQLALRKKVAVCIAFSFRTLAIACAAWRISLIPRFFDRDADITFDSWLPTVVTVLEVFSSVFAACVPHLRPFMESIQAGYLSGVIQENDGRFGYGNNSYIMGKTARSKAGSAVRSQALKTTNNEDEFGQSRQGTPAAIRSNQVIVTTTISGGRSEKTRTTHGDRSDSICSAGGISDGSRGSQIMIIKTKREWSVRYQDA